MLLALFAGCQKQPDIDVKFQLVGDELYVCFIHIQNLGATPISVSRINVNQEIDLPLDGDLKLSPGQKLVFPYKLYEWPQPHDVALQTDQGIYRKKFDMEWPKLAILAELQRRSRNPNKAPVPAPTEAPKATESVSVRIEGRNSWPGAAPVVLPLPSPPEATPTPEPSPTPTATPAALVSSKNPEYSGSHINRTSNQSGALVLTFDTFLTASDGGIEIGGKMKLGTFAPFAVSGQFVPASGLLTLTQASPVRATWNGSLSGQKLRGTFKASSFGREETGVWETVHSGGLDILQAAGLSSMSPNGVAPAEQEQTATSVEYVAVPVDASMTRLVLFSKKQNRVIDSRVWEFSRPVRPSEIVKMDGKTAIVADAREK